MADRRRRPGPARHRRDAHEHQDAARGREPPAAIVPALQTSDGRAGRARRGRSDRGIAKSARRAPVVVARAGQLQRAQQLVVPLAEQPPGRERRILEARGSEHDARRRGDEEERPRAQETQAKQHEFVPVERSRERHPEGDQGDQNHPDHQAQPRLLDGAPH